jgi:hypothetical protein
MSHFDREITTLNDRKQRLQKNEAAALEVIQEAEEIDEWVEGDINWLDELRELSEEFPEADKAIVTQLSASALTSGGRMTLTGAVNDSATVTAIEEAIVDDRHDVKGRGARPTEDIERYERSYTKIVNVKPFYPDAAEGGEPGKPSP